MIYEFRTYTCVPTTQGEAVKRFAEAYEHRKQYSELTAFWTSDIGPLNEIIHVWGYKDLADRARVRAEASKATGWPSKLGDLVTRMRSEIVVPFPFLPDVKPGKMGPIFELRYYTLRAGAYPTVMKNWQEKLPERMKLSPLVLAGSVEFGHANGFVHIWAYESLEQRARVRAEAIKRGIWPPPGGRDNLLTQESKILLPAPFSPLQ